MADSVFHSVASATDYRISYSLWGDVYLSWAFNVDITIYETPRESGNDPIIGELYCHFPTTGGAVARYQPGPQSGTGAGFFNAAGIMWGNGTFTPQNMPLRLPPYGSDSDNRNTMLAQLDAATTDYFARFSFCDYGDPQFEASTPAGANFKRYIHASELASDGTLPSLTLAILFARWYDHDDATGPGSGYDYEARVTQQGAITSAAMSLDWHYYPWARKLSDAWESCNRDYDTASANRSAYLRRKESGSWQDVLNTMQPSGQDDQMSWRKQGGVWKYALPYGNNA